MEIHQLHCFIAVVEEGGFNRACTRLLMTQPAISYQIKQLETELSVRLFTRRPRGISITDAGRTLYHHVQEIFEAVRQAEHSIERLQNGVAGEIRVGTVNSVGMYLLPEVLKAMREKYPKVRPVILYRSASEILRALRSNQVDMAILANPVPDKRFRQEVVFEELTSLYCGRIHPFFKKDEVTLDDLRGTPLVALTSENPTGQMVQEHFARLSLPWEPVVSTDNVETVKKMVEIGLGVAFIPDMVMTQDIIPAKRSASRFARFTIPPLLKRRIVLMTWKRVGTTPASAALISLLRAHCSKRADRTGRHPEPVDVIVEPEAPPASTTGPRNTQKAVV